MPVSPQPPVRIAELGSSTDQISPRELAIPVLRSNDLFGKAREILIEHGGSFYRLRLTHSNKLILTK